MNAIEKFKAKLPWLFGTHYKIERFGVIFFLLLVCLVSSFGFAQKQHMDAMAVQLGDQVMYTTAFQMSVSHAPCEVMDIRVSEDKTKCFIMLRWTDMTNVVTDASAYSMFLCGAGQDGDYEQILSRPVGTVYMFGATGYMGIYLVDTNGFPSQILSLTLRSTNNFVAPDGAEPLPDSYMDDASFLTSDQARIFFNPGGALSKTATCLEDGNMNAYNIYTSFFCEETEAEIKANMDVALETMYEQVTVIDNVLHTQLGQVGLQTPNAPLSISEVSNPVVPYTQMFQFDDENKPIDLITQQNLSKSVLFDWRNGDIHIGYQDEVLSLYPEYDNLNDLISAKTDMRESFSFSTSIQWYDTAGVMYTPSVNATSVLDKNRSAVISSLTSAWQKYYEAKTAYQVTYPLELLSLERDARDTVALYTMNQGVLRVY